MFDLFLTSNLIPSAFTDWRFSFNFNKLIFVSSQTSKKKSFLITIIQQNTHRSEKSMKFHYLNFSSILSWRNSNDLKRNYWWVIWSFFSLFLLQFWFWQIPDKASDKKKSVTSNPETQFFWCQYTHEQLKQ